MMKWLGISLALLGLVLLGSFVASPRYAQETAPEPASEAAAPSDKPVTEADLQLYIDVYKAMQSDHSLKLEDILTSRGIALADFRQLERRIQSKSALVERVRTSLLEHARQQPVLALQQAPSPHGTPEAPEVTPAH